WRLFRPRPIRVASCLDWRPMGLPVWVTLIEPEAAFFVSFFASVFASAFTAAGLACAFSASAFFGAALGAAFGLEAGLLACVVMGYSFVFFSCSPTSDLPSRR